MLGSQTGLDNIPASAIEKIEIINNPSDLANTMVVREDIRGNGFNYVGYDYYETQVIRIGYSYKF